jgi:hypothetical protein
MLLVFLAVGLYFGLCVGIEKWAQMMRDPDATK